MCLVRSTPDVQRRDALPPTVVHQLSRLSSRRSANDNRSPQASAWRAAGALFGAGLAGTAALAVAFVRLGSA
jgi:hypothetical protein